MAGTEKMIEDWVRIDYKFYRQKDGKIRQEIWAGSQLLYESIAMNFWYSVFNPSPRFMMPIQDPRDARSCIDGSCLVTSLMKEGPKAIVPYKKL
jgi:hypothetical protein